MWRTTPNIRRQDVRNGTLQLRPEQFQQYSAGATILLLRLAQETGLTADLEKIYGLLQTQQLLTLSLYQILEGNSAFYLVPAWLQRYVVPTRNGLSSSNISALLQEVGQDTQALQRLFVSRAQRYRGKEYFSFDSTKILSHSNNINDVHWAPSQQGLMQPEIGLAILCTHRTKSPVMFRRFPGNVVDVKTTRELICRWREYGIDQLATAVLDRGYNSAVNIQALAAAKIPFVMAQSTANNLVREVIDKHITEFWCEENYCTLARAYAVSCQKTLSGNEQYPLWFHAFFSESTAALTGLRFHQRLDQYEKDWAAGKAQEDNPMRRYFLPQLQQGKLQRDHSAINAALRYKGFFCIVSNTIASAQMALEIYRARDCVEKVFRGLQSDLDVDSTTSHGDEALDGRLLVYFISLILLSELTWRMQQKDAAGNSLLEKKSVAELLGEFKNIQRFKAPQQEARYSEITGVQEKMLQALQVPDLFSTALSFA